MMVVSGITQQGEKTGTDEPVVNIDTKNGWRQRTGATNGTTIERTHPVGGRFDLIGNGALLLRKRDREAPFYETTAFRKNGTWTSRWHSLDRDTGVTSIRLQYWVYGRIQKMETDWTKFSGNPLVTRKGWKHTTDETLLLSDPTAKPADQSLAKGAGKWSDRWLLFFNIGGYAKNGWGMAVADSLSPLKKGKNPFEVAEPYPPVTGEEQRSASEYNKHAPNDFMYVERDERWYAPDETHGGPSHMWSATPDAFDWTLEGPIKGIKGHDPGMAFDGERYHLFTENGTRIHHCVADDPTGTWTSTGNVLNVGRHTGDPDVSFFNNRWHVFFDDGPHGKYRLGYAWTTPEEFPDGWRTSHQFFGPHKPEQNQLWDNYSGGGNSFGTGDGDLGLEGKTLYLTYEFPVGVAYREMNVLDGSGQRVEVNLDLDLDGDQDADQSTGWLHTKPGNSRVDVPQDVPRKEARNVRVRIRLRTEKSHVSPVIRKLVLDGGK